MIKKIYPGKLQGEIIAPPSKSYMQRAVAIGLLSNGRTEINNPSFCNDAMSTISMARELGAEIQINPNKVIIKGAKQLKGVNLSAGESGLGIRMFAPIAALANKTIIISGEGSLTNRPLKMLEEPLQKLGAEISTNNSFLPLRIKGPLRGGEVSVDGRISSQFLSGLLITLPLVAQDSIIRVNALQSKPYIDMTLDIINKFGVSIENQNYEKFLIDGRQKYSARNFTIEGDWSSAAFHLVAAAISGSIAITNLNINSKQADIRIMNALISAGADIDYEKTDGLNTHTVKVNRSKLNAFEFDATHCPDLFPPLVVLCAACKGQSILKGVNRLSHKESDRASVLKKEMEKIGISIIIENDNMIINGGTFHSGSIQSHNDHRIAMAASVAALITDYGIEIKGTDAVQKSYPDFFKDLDSLTR